MPDLNAPPLLRPLGLVKVSAGFPSPAEDYEDRSLDINQYLIDKPASTFFFQVKGDSMDSFGIHDGDFLVCDKSIDPKNGDVVVAFLNGERLVKQLQMRADRVRLIAGNPEYPPLVITPESQFEVWGVVVGRFGRLQKARRPE
ncbi:S24 family peptidase [Nostoc sp. CHAB 5834]|nr:S24 family peptidase [Nostoc sp. CHAB 5834]